MALLAKLMSRKSGKNIRKIEDIIKNSEFLKNLLKTLCSKGKSTVARSKSTGEKITL